VPCKVSIIPINMVSRHIDWGDYLRERNAQRGRIGRIEKGEDGYQTYATRTYVSTWTVGYNKLGEYKFQLRKFL